jgi:hypothetical protein
VKKTERAFDDIWRINYTDIFIVPPQFLLLASDPTTARQS